MENKTLAKILIPICVVVGLFLGMLGQGVIHSALERLEPTPGLVFDISSHISIPALDSIIAIIEEDCCKVKAVTFSRAGTPELTITFVEKEEVDE